uniref:MYND-type domain-containing protein n=1 Tax=Chromera velia CCMP2878 TaxID=1169474 RepID=A0A0G4I794_9ALVE|eukprot:Cvel_11626.t1-p1 / transcript=Cvel_11626.t1 / gene=Cvel_11626 / organism=Chromera_velia_CCMP2878 / gene_product=hypothetical protein / transcript_product=hypothetical protein / location=Cvel_scaffold736:49884-52514(+) / protein_length=543 / sequence_SO=supercontig / SO=protein_coding / is_pseudo=false
MPCHTLSPSTKKESASSDVSTSSSDRAVLSSPSVKAVSSLFWEMRRQMPEELRGVEFASVREAALDVAVHSNLCMRLWPGGAKEETETAQEGGALPSLQKWHRICRELAAFSETLRRVIFFLPREKGFRASMLLLLTPGFFRSALTFFSFFSSPSCDFKKPSPMLSCALSGAVILSTLMGRNEALRLLMWKSTDFKRALKLVVKKAPFSKKKPEESVAAVYCIECLLSSFHGTKAALSHETIRDFNYFKAPDAEEEEGQPLDFSHLLRAAVLSHRSKRNQEGRKWSSIAMKFQDIALRNQYHDAAQSAFASSDANGDALGLFDLAISDFDTNGNPPSNSSSLNLEERATAVRCTLPNPAVREFVSKRKRMILARLESMTKDISEVPGMIVSLQAWLHTHTEVLSRRRRKLQGLSRSRHDLEVNTRKLSLEALASECDPFNEIILDPQYGEKLENRTFHPSKVECRKRGPQPACVVCASRVPTFQFCSVCKLAVYCGKECQKKGWKTQDGILSHRQACHKLRKSVTDVAFQGVFVESQCFSKLS